MQKEEAIRESKVSMIREMPMRDQGEEDVMQRRGGRSTTAILVVTVAHASIAGIGLHADQAFRYD